MSYSEFDTPWVEEPWESPETALRDADGTRLYETDDSGLLFKIIYLNDVPRLKQYLPVYSPPLDIEDKEFNDPFCVAASQGRTDILRVLVDYYKNDSTKVPLHQRKFSLLTAACREAQLETAQFILDSQLALSSVYIDQAYRDEALLATARSLTALPPSDCKHETPNDSEHWRSSRIARAEELMRLLLDGGASAQAAEIPTTEVEWATMVLFGGSVSRHDGDNSQPLQSFGTVLGLASSGAGYALVNRLIDQGANVHAKEQYQHQPSSTFWSEMQMPWDVTALHVSSMYWNLEAIQTLLDRGGRTITESLSCRDSNGRLPLHWAAAGPGSFECWLSDDKVGNRVIDAFKLLCSGSDINARDNQGETALHYAVRGHACCGGSKHFGTILRFMLENGAGADVINTNGQTVLHKMAAHCLAGDPIDTALIDTLLSQGVKINQQDKDGNTPLHLMARNLRQVQATRFLISQGADVSLTNGNGNTALHECLRMGTILHRQTSNGSVRPTLADRTRALDEMVAVLLEVGGDTMMDQPNLAGETPRQLEFKKLAMWQKLEEDAIARKR
ncbi:uncharacterized protein N7496_011423 [Penicillium cataractarum]|uniref:Uncharacterized protein n=1 Tax=Penicillium cataractarum TaxID=2100454 RepID=A0A9W9RGC5_9EURO|nr:uncharacterized protein N7496_011423 [Penicillium cataractarum]KAJ5359010.1 hypothetical protein N7496_011423 [Penicillium cataractarum]